MSDILNVVIIGSGPAGCSAAVYTARANLSPVLIAGPEVGGQLTTTPEIGNWPGAGNNPSGYDLMHQMHEHAKALGTKFISDKVVKVNLQSEIKEIFLSSGDVLKTKSVIIATGAYAKYLNIPSEQKYKGKGISACATCDGFFFRGKEVAVIGGGSAAFVEALFLTNFCSKVYIVHRREGFRAEGVLVNKLKELASEGKVEFVLNAQVKEYLGDENSLTGLLLDVQGKEVNLPVKGAFVAIGHQPATELFVNQLELDKDGYIQVNKSTATATSIPGVFAAGDCADKIYRQAITSAGTGCMAALDVEHYLL